MRFPTWAGARAAPQNRSPQKSIDKGKNEFWRVYHEAQKDPDWFYMMLRASDSGIIPTAELEKLRIEQGEDFYQQDLNRTNAALVLPRGSRSGILSA
jgi:hypothetical protein